MGNFEEVFARLGVQQIREFLMGGVECVSVSSQTYQQRLADKRSPMHKMMEVTFPDKDEYEKAMDRIYDYTAELEDVYMEIGIRCGAILALDLFYLNR